MHIGLRQQSPDLFNSNAQINLVFMCMTRGEFLIVVQRDQEAYRERSFQLNVLIKSTFFAIDTLQLSAPLVV